MDWGVLTTIVAATFTVIGLILGFALTKLLGHKTKQDFTPLEEELKAISGKVENLLNDLQKEISSLKEEKLLQLRNFLSELAREISRLKETSRNLPLSPDSRSALETAEKLLKEIDLSLPSCDTSLLTQVKDNLMIIRNDLQNLQMNEAGRQEKQFSEEKLSQVIQSIESALSMAKSLNQGLVKDEMLVLSNVIKEPDKSEVLKDLDRQVITSKELVILIENVKKELEGVAK